MRQKKLMDYDDGVGTCRFLIADNTLCNTKLVERIGKDYWFCPKCCPDAVRANERDNERKGI